MDKCEGAPKKSFHMAGVFSHIMGRIQRQMDIAREAERRLELDEERAARINPKKRERALERLHEQAEQHCDQLHRQLRRTEGLNEHYVRQLELAQQKIEQLECRLGSSNAQLELARICLHTRTAELMALRLTTADLQAGDTELDSSSSDK